VNSAIGWSPSKEVEFLLWELPSSREKSADKKSRLESRSHKQVHALHPRKDSAARHKLLFFAFINF
jgi:hypothetical protein